MSEAYLYLGVEAIVASRAMRLLLELVERMARTSATVLITGETGTGKEIVARAIHHYSLRTNKPWVDFNCAALPEHLVESELFGHEKGAFSGADAAKPGLFEMAHTGTLFLDEIGDLDVRMQVKLLRVLDGVPYYRVGGQKKVAVDARIVAATNQDLEAAVQRGRFRGDLFYRLNQCQVRVPPLRERRDDIVPIAEYFLRQHSAQASLSAAANSALERYHWPGNVRELRNVVTRAVVAARDYEIGLADLSLGEPAPPPIAGPADSRLDEVERETILAALDKVAGHHQKAADLLGISRRTLTRKLKLYRAAEVEDSVHVC
ncbi:MAG: sigma-54 dependent transcriptional regulator [Bryobacteraceae bacterium]|jgi:transcriptional regulator with PAS, ATPase and Fis domain